VEYNWATRLPESSQGKLRLVQGFSYLFDTPYSNILACRERDHPLNLEQLGAAWLFG